MQLLSFVVAQSACAPQTTAEAEDSVMHDVSGASQEVVCTTKQRPLNGIDGMGGMGTAPILLGKEQRGTGAGQTSRTQRAGCAGGGARWWRRHKQPAEHKMAGRHRQLHKLLCHA